MGWGSGRAVMGWGSGRVVMGWRSGRAVMGWGSGRAVSLKKAPLSSELGNLWQANRPHEKSRNKRVTR